MSNDIRIIKQLSETQYVIETTPNRKPKGVNIMHDFVQFSGITHLSTERGLTIKNKNGHGSNGFLINTSVQIPIRIFSKFVLPHLNNDEYLKEGSTHLDDREDENGNKYPSYTYYKNGVAVQYWDKENKELMVAFIKKGDRVPTLMTLSFYEEYVKPTLL